MDLIHFFDTNFEEEQINEERSDELDNLFEDFLRENIKPKKEFSLKFFLEDMDPSADEDEEPDFESPSEETREPISDNFEGGENILEEGEINSEENNIKENKNKEEFQTRLRDFPSGVREEVRICEECELPLSRKSMKRHLMDKHDIDTRDVDDYCVTKTVVPEFRKLETNSKTGRPQVRVKFRGKNGSTKMDCFPTNQLWGLSSFRKYIRNTTKNGTRRQKRIISSDQMKREKSTRKMAVKQYGRWAETRKYECSICKKRKRAINASVFCHNDDDNEVAHSFCTPCIRKWVKVKGESCPYCRREGVSIKIYH